MGEERVQDFGLLLVVVSKDLFGFPPSRESTLASLIKPPGFILIASRACFSLRSTTNLARNSLYRDSRYFSTPVMFSPGFARVLESRTCTSQVLPSLMPKI